jgi:hypothetical protein
VTFLAIGKRQRRVKMEEVRAVLRTCFARWGTLPDEIQTDGETVLVNPHQDGFPSSVIKQLPAKSLEVSDLTGLAAWPSGPGAQQLLLPLSLTEGVSC